MQAKFDKIGDAAKTLAKYATEHWTAFKNAEVLTPLSPRGIKACASTYMMYRAVMDDSKAMKQAMLSAFVHRAGKEDAQTITGLIERVSK